MMKQAIWDCGVNKKKVIYFIFEFLKEAALFSAGFTSLVRLVKLLHGAGVSI